MSKAGITEYIGTVIELYHQDLDGFFSAGLFKEDHLGQMIRFRGKVILGTDDRVRIRGCWVSDPRFGAQFEILDFDYLHPPYWAQGIKHAKKQRRDPGL